MCPVFKQTQPTEKIIQHEVMAKPLEIFGTDMFTLHNGNNLCIVDYLSKFPVIKKMKDLSADSFMLTCQIIFFSEYG